MAGGDAPSRPAMVVPISHAPLQHSRPGPGALFELAHLVQRGLGNPPLGGVHVGGQVLRIHVRLPELPRFAPPDLPRTATVAAMASPRTDPSPEAQNPRHLRPFFGRTPALTSEQRRVIGLVALGAAFEQYDMGVLTAALPQISADLGMAAGESGLYMSAIRLGGFGSVLLLPFADRVGRRAIFLLSLAGMSIGAFATAFSPNAEVFAVLQLITRAFLLTVYAAGIVILVEELHASQRASGIGLLALLSGLGYGLAAGLYAAIDVLPGGWRFLYMVGGLPLLLLPFFRRSLRETERYARHAASRSGGAAASGWLNPVREMASANPRRAMIIGAAAFFSSMGGIAFFQYTSFFVQDVHGWAPSGYSLLVLAGGLIGITGSIVGGRLADRIGRRAVGVTVLLLAPFCVALFYRGPSASLVPAWGLCVFCFGAGDIVLRALGGELFGTSHRSTSLGWLTLVQTLGWTFGLLLVGMSSADTMRELAKVISWVAASAALAALCLLVLPPTHGRELESIAPERLDADGV